MGVGGQHHAPTALPPRKNGYPLYSRLCGPQGRSGRVRKISPHRDSSSDRPACSESLYRLSYRGPWSTTLVRAKWRRVAAPMMVMITHSNSTSVSYGLLNFFLSPPAPFPNQDADILQMHFYNNSDTFQVWPGHGTDPKSVLSRTFEKNLSISKTTRCEHTWTSVPVPLCTAVTMVSDMSQMYTSRMILGAFAK